MGSKIESISKLSVIKLGFVIATILLVYTSIIYEAFAQPKYSAPNIAGGNGPQKTAISTSSVILPSNSNNNTSISSNTTNPGNVPKQTAINTFNASGLIDTLISNTSKVNASSNNNSSNSSTSSTGSTSALITQQKRLSTYYILGGYWSLDVVVGKVRQLESNFTMVHLNGTGYHTHQLTNFKPNSVVPVLLDPKGMTFIGIMDIKLNGHYKWYGVQTTIAINKLNTIAIYPNPKYTANHFNGQPIFGIVTSIKDQNGKELITKSHSP